MSFEVASRQAVDDIHCDMTSAGCRGLQAPFDAFWDARHAIRDPDGLAVGPMSPFSGDHKSSPPQV